MLQSHINLSKLFTLVSLAVSLLIFQTAAQAKKRRVSSGGRTAVVVDERLSVLRDAPDLSGNLLQRLGRGRVVSLRGSKVGRDGVAFFRVAVTSRTTGWIQADALASGSRAGDDERLLKLIRGSEGFDRIERATIFLELFPRSTHRPAVLMLLGNAAQSAAQTLTRNAERRLDAREMQAGGAPVHSYFLNYSGLDRFNRLGVRFAFNSDAKKFYYDGESWREILRRHQQSPEALEARRLLDSISSLVHR